MLCVLWRAVWHALGCMSHSIALLNSYSLELTMCWAQCEGLGINQILVTYLTISPNTFALTIILTRVHG